MNIIITKCTIFKIVNTPILSFLSQKLLPSLLRHLLKLAIISTTSLWWLQKTMSLWQEKEFLPIKVISHMSITEFLKSYFSQFLSCLFYKYTSYKKSLYLIHCFVDYWNNGQLNCQCNFSICISKKSYWIQYLNFSTEQESNITLRLEQPPEASSKEKCKCWC